MIAPSTFPALKTRFRALLLAATLVTPGLLWVTSSLHAQGPPSNRAPFAAGYVHHFKTGIDDGGDVSSHFFNLKAGVPFYRAEGRYVGLSASYRLNAYDFSGGAPTSLAGLNPWDNIHTFQLGTPVRWTFNDQWSFFGIPSARFTGESGADVSDSLTGGVIAGLSYRFNDRLSLGPGFGYLTQLEDSASIFPVILIDWKLTDSLSLTTGPTVGATLGPGLALNWQMNDATLFSFGARYERLRFRLEEDARTAPGGIGEDRSVPVFAAVSHRFDNGWNLALIGGVGFSGQLEVADDRGRTVSKQDFDPSPFLGFNASWSF